MSFNQSILYLLSNDEIFHYLKFNNMKLEITQKAYKLTADMVEPWHYEGITHLKSRLQ